MHIASGKIEYKLGDDHVKGIGFSYTKTEIEEALSGIILELLSDERGKADIEAMLAGVTETEFEKKQLANMLDDAEPVEAWRVGEILAEAYLRIQRNCFFPWPTSRDVKKIGSSMPGADLVGFQRDGDEYYFAFGEVKTSSQEEYPPRLMYGRTTGLKKQVEDLKNSESIKDTLVKYLGHRVVKTSCLQFYKSAVKKYFKNKSCLRVFGFMVRDVTPQHADLRARVNGLMKNSHADMVIELLAMYLPKESIATLSDKILEYRNGEAK